jgi:hypothetical protein
MPRAPARPGEGTKVLALPIPPRCGRWRAAGGEEEKGVADAEEGAAGKKSPLPGSLLLLFAFMSDATPVLEAAMVLPESECRALALQHLDTVRGEPVEEIERLWLAEARSRREEAGADWSGRISWEDARARISSGWRATCP